MVMKRAHMGKAGRLLIRRTGDAPAGVNWAENSDSSEDEHDNRIGNVRRGQQKVAAQQTPLIFDRPAHLSARDQIEMCFVARIEINCLACQDPSCESAPFLSFNI